ncbi:MAG: nuclear transport factor 2 family protein [Myxococcales bacterium]|nr:nuclear transport factor 2 family protein [Myxococcales bacterium]
MRLNPNLTWKLVEKRLAEESSPTRARNLELVLAHMKAEARADIEGVVATLTEKPKYIIHSSPDVELMNPNGSKDAVRAFYDATIVQTGAHRLEYACDRVVVDDDAVFTEGVMRMAYPGKTLVAMGIEVDDQDAYYLSEYRMGVVWPVDHSEDRLTGEEVYSGGDGFEGIADRKISLEDIAALEAA